MECITCNGLGVCPRCEGEGEIHETAPTPLDCPLCDGSGNCPDCRGFGETS